MVAIDGNANRNELTYANVSISKTEKA